MGAEALGTTGINCNHQDSESHKVANKATDEVVTSETGCNLQNLLHPKDLGLLQKHLGTEFNLLLLSHNVFGGSLWDLIGGKTTARFSAQAHNISNIQQIVAESGNPLLLTLLQEVFFMRETDNFADIEGSHTHEGATGLRGLRRLVGLLAGGLTAISREEPETSQFQIFDHLIAPDTKLFTKILQMQDLLAGKGFQTLTWNICDLGKISVCNTHLTASYNDVSIDDLARLSQLKQIITNLETEYKSECGLSIIAGDLNFDGRNGDAPHPHEKAAEKTLILENGYVQVPCYIDPKEGTVENGQVLDQIWIKIHSKEQYGITDEQFKEIIEDTTAIARLKLPLLSETSVAVTKDEEDEKDEYEMRSLPGKTSDHFPVGLFISPQKMVECIEKILQEGAKKDKIKRLLQQLTGLGIAAKQKTLAVARVSQ